MSDAHGETAGANKVMVRESGMGGRDVNFSDPAAPPFTQRQKWQIPSDEVMDETPAMSPQTLVSAMNILKFKLLTNVPVYGSG